MAINLALMHVSSMLTYTGPFFKQILTASSTPRNRAHLPLPSHCTTVPAPAVRVLAHILERHTQHVKSRTGDLCFLVKFTLKVYCISCNTTNKENLLHKHSVTTPHNFGHIFLVSRAWICHGGWLNLRVQRPYKDCGMFLSPTLNLAQSITISPSTFFNNYPTTNPPSYCIPGLEMDPSDIDPVLQSGLSSTVAPRHHFPPQLQMA